MYTTKNVLVALGPVDLKCVEITAGMAKDFLKEAAMIFMSFAEDDAGAWD